MVLKFAVRHKGDSQGKNDELAAINRPCFSFIFGAVRQNLKMIEAPMGYRARTYGETNISRFRHGWLLLKMSRIAFKKIKWLRKTK